METEVEIDEDTIFTILTKARDIEDGQTVTKVRGTNEYVFRKNLRVYSDAKGEKPIEIQGYFLFSPSGTVNQIKDPDTVLCVQWAAWRLYDTLQAIFDRDPDDGK